MKKKAWKQNLIFAAVLLLAAAALFGWRAWKNVQNQNAGLPLTARLLYGDSGEKLDIPLEEDGVFDVDTGYYTVHIEVQDGAARFIDSPCPDHVCESFGWVSLEDQSATCMPARAVLVIVPKQ